MTKENYDYELRRGYGPDAEILLKGTLDEVNNRLSEIAQKNKCGVGLLVNNMGYVVVELERERQEKIRAAAPALFDALKNLAGCVESIKDDYVSYKSVNTGDRNETEDAKRFFLHELLSQYEKLDDLLAKSAEALNKAIS